MLDWNKDRSRQLTKRAIAEEMEDQQQLHAAQPSRKQPLRQSKAANRAFADEIAQQYEIAEPDRDPRGAWEITCESCAHSFPAKIALSTALETLIRCPECDHGHWLSEEDRRLPWE
jgi:hypothetical protein